MERSYQIKTDDSFIVHGLSNTKKYNKALIIFVHGLTGEKEHHLYYNAARFFPEYGFDSFRFDLFSNEDKGRKLAECSLSTFSSDLDMVVSYFRKSYEKIHLVGHSIGGCIVINANHKYIESLVLWDSIIFDRGKAGGPFIFNDCLGQYIANLKITYLLSKQLVEERSRQDETTLASIEKPVKIIAAGKNNLHSRWKEKLSFIKVPCEFFIIENAGHGFNEDGVNEILYQNTLKWFLRKPFP